MLNVVPFAQSLIIQNATVASSAERRASTAARQTNRQTEEIAHLPFDLSAFENEGIFVVRRVTRY